MPPQSMTGFGQAQMNTAIGQLAVELRTVNNRFHDLALSLPRELANCEMPLRALLRATVTRGRVDVRVRFTSPTSGANALLNVELVREWVQQLRALRELGVHGEITPDTVLAIPGVAQGGVTALDEEVAWAALRPVVDQALAALARERAREGAALAEQLVADGRRIAELRELVHAQREAIVSRYRTRLTERIAELEAETRAKLEPGRLEMEVAMFADKADISEETVRLGVHLDRFFALLAHPAEESIGKQLEFLLQEFGREINTICSKARDTDVTGHALEMKNLVERIREQAANVQ